MAGPHDDGLRLSWDHVMVLGQARISVRLPSLRRPQAPVERGPFDWAYERVKVVVLPVREPDEAWAG